MLPETRDLTWLLDILLEAQHAREAIEGVAHDAFLLDWRVQHITTRCIEVIGEAANRISADFQTAHPEIAWSKIIEMRNIMIHHYHRIDYEFLWDVIQNDLPDLISKIAPLVPPEVSD